MSDAGLRKAQKAQGEPRPLREPKILAIGRIYYADAKAGVATDEEIAVLADPAARVEFRRRARDGNGGGAAPREGLQRESGARPMEVRSDRNPQPARTTV